MQSVNRYEKMRIDHYKYVFKMKTKSKCIIYYIFIILMLHQCLKKYVSPCFALKGQKS